MLINIDTANPSRILAKIVEFGPQRAPARPATEFGNANWKIY